MCCNEWWAVFGAKCGSKEVSSLGRCVTWYMMRHKYEVAMCYMDVVVWLCVTICGGDTG